MFLGCPIRPVRYVTTIFDKTDMEYLRAPTDNLGAVQTGSAEVSEVSRIVKLSVQWSSDDFAAASRNSGKNLCWVLEIDVVCLRLFCEWRMTERLVFDGEKNENNALQSYYVAFTPSKKCWLVNFSSADMFLGQLFNRVDLIKPVSNVRLWIRLYVSLSTKSFFDLNENWHVEVDEWCMTVCSMTRSKVKSTSKLEMRPRMGQFFVFVYISHRRNAYF